MTDPDDEALTWDGDDRLQAPARPGTTAAHDPGPSVAGGSLDLVVIGVLGGIALLETVFWVRSALQPTIAGTVTPGSGEPLMVAAFVVNLIGRALAVVAPLVWFLAALRWFHVRAKRFAWLALGAVLLVPWPAVLGAV